MIATDKFNFIHLPKTGGSFTQKIIAKVYKNKAKSIHSKIKQKLKIEYCVKHWNTEKFLFTTSEWGQHGGVNEIPNKYSNKPILSIIRNPFDWYASLYGFRYWENKACLLDNLSFEMIPSFPDISFEEMYKIYNKVVTEYGETINLNLSNIGYYTWHWVIYYTKSPNEVLQILASQKNINLDTIKPYFHNVKFIHQENLNDELYQYLKELGFKNLDFILNEEKILPLGKGRASHKDAWKDLVPDSIYNDIKKKEAFLFKLYPEYEKAS